MTDELTPKQKNALKARKWREKNRQHSRDYQREYRRKYRARKKNEQ